MKQITDIFIELVKLDSPSGLEKPVSSYIESWLKNHDFTYNKDSLGNIITSHHEKCPFFICSHMDTVSAGNGIYPIMDKHWIATDKSSILGADNKATIAAILFAWEKYIQEISNPRPLQFIFTVREEIGDGLIHLPHKWISAKRGLLFDCAEPLGGIILNSPWIANFHIKIMGKSAHASSPKKGVNVLPDMTTLLSNIAVGQISKYTSLNIGKIIMGKSINTIPDNATISGEIRSFNKKEFFFMIEKIKKLIRMHHYTTITWSQDGLSPGYSHNKKDANIQSLQKIFKKQKMKSRFLVKKSSVSDANIFNDWGIKSYNCTDGVCNAHTNNEKISIHALTALSNIILRCFHEW